MGIIKSILRFIAGVGIFIYGYYHDTLDSELTIGLRWFVSAVIWIAFFTLINLSDDC